MPPEQPVKKSFRLAAGLFEPSKKVKKSFDPTRKGTLTVPFHTIFPLQILRQESLSAVLGAGLWPVPLCPAQNGRPSPPVSCCMVEAESLSAARKASFTAATIMS